MRVAALDLGTNTTRLLVADVADGTIQELLRRSEITRLGEGVDARRRLLPLPITRVRNVLADYRRQLETLGAERALAVATSAVRDAENGEAFLGEVEWSYGFKTRLLTGDEEAALTFRGATNGRGAAPGTLIVDVGGGSTELVQGRAEEPTFHVSLDVGAVRLTERFVRSDPPSAHELAACRAAVRAALEQSIPDAVRRRTRSAIGVAGTVTTLAALELGLEPYDPVRVHGHVIGAETVERQLARLASVPLSERRMFAGLEPERAQVIVAGVALVRELLDFFSLPGIEASERDLLDGVALEAVTLPAPTEGDAPPGAYTCC